MFFSFNFFMCKLLDSETIFIMFICNSYYGSLNLEDCNLAITQRQYKSDRKCF